MAEDVEMADPVGAQDIVVNEEEKEIIDLGDNDDELDHPRSSDDDLEDSDAPPRVREMKPVIAPSGVIVKVEKEWWALEKEKRMKRIARHEEKERKERERQQKDKELAEAKAKLIRLELESQKRINDFNSQLQEMRMLIASQASQGWAASSQAPPPPPPVPFFKTPAEEHVQVLVSQLHHPRVEGKDQATSLPHGDVIVFTPASQLPRVTSPDQNIVEVLPQPQDEAATSAVPEEA